jgi:hypothetical protein
MPTKGTRYTSPLPPRGPKTGRPYGQVVSAVRNSGLEYLTNADFPQFDTISITRVLVYMHRAGELDKVRDGKRGRFGSIRTVYKKNR